MSLCTYNFYVICIIAREDYNGSPITFSVPARLTMQPFTIIIIDNNIVECNETFNITVISVTTCGVTMGSINSVVGIIRDNDGKQHSFLLSFVNIIWSTGATVSLSQSQYSIAESNNSLTGTITLSSRTSKDVIVEVTINDGSANGNVE